VLDHVNGRNMLSDFQFGFRHGHSTVTALVWKAEEKVTVHVPWTKAFDLINHGLFVHKVR
jgi:hypothetical protein